MDKKIDDLAAAYAISWGIKKKIIAATPTSPEKAVKLSELADKLKVSLQRLAYQVSQMEKLGVLKTAKNARERMVWVDVKNVEKIKKRFNI